MKSKTHIFFLLLFFISITSFGLVSARETQNVILVTLDGLRVEEMFGGVDPLMLSNKERSGIENVEELKEKYWRESAEERRRALLPFFWGELIKQGVILGNTEKNSSVLVKNPHCFSYPGYAEILTGQPQPKIDSNKLIPNPALTVLDFIQGKRTADEPSVAAFGSWNVFNGICSSKPDSFYINAGYERVSDEVMTDEMKILDELQFQMMTPWDTVRFDPITGGLALAYLKQYKPRLLYVALGETDDWAHNRRYDRVINSAHYFDTFMKDLWTVLEADEQYRGKTSIVITTDHGRGLTLDDWTDHGSKVVGADKVWIAVIGPDTPNRGELSDTPQYYFGSTASTVVELLGFDYKEFNPEAEPPVREAFE